jgi:lipopolysaccharide export system permease protein
VIPLSNPKAEYIRRVQIEKKQDKTFQYRRDQIFRTLSDNRFIYIKKIDIDRRLMEGVQLFVLNNDRTIKERIEASQVSWQPREWTFFQGTRREFSNGQVSAFQAFEKYPLSIRDDPRAFIHIQRDDDELLGMRLIELWKKIQSLKGTGGDPRIEEVNFHLKIAFPFSNFVLALLGVSIPFIFPSGKRAMLWGAIGFVITLVTGFFYIGFIAIGTSFGKNGSLSPWLAAWSANILFFILGVYLLRRAQT